MTQTPTNPPALAVDPTVKPLVWSLGDDEITAEALGVKRFYRIYGQPGRWELIYPYDAAMRYDGPFETQIQAREAAQAEYECRILSAIDQPADPPEGDRLRWFIHIIAKVNLADASDHDSNWVTAFCDDRGNGSDTFNIAIDRGLIWASHDTDSDHSTCGITDAGKAFAAANPPATPDQAIKHVRGSEPGAI